MEKLTSLYKWRMVIDLDRSIECPAPCLSPVGAGLAEVPC